MRPETFGIEYEELSISTRDGFQLNTWVMQPTNGQARAETILIVGSDAGNMGFSLPYAVYLLRAGYQVVTFDYRGFGASTDFDYNPDNLYHSEYITDFITVMGWCKKELQSEKIGVLAFSMGTFISAVGYSEMPFDFFIGEGLVLSPALNQRRIKNLKDKEIYLPHTAATDARRVKALSIPVLLFAGTEDEITTVQDSESFCTRRSKAQTVLFEGEHLRGAATLGMDRYILEIQGFIEKME